MKANDYDKFALMRQQELLNGEKLPHRYVEKPMMIGMLPSLKNKKILMVGCGSGEESTIFKERGVSEIFGIDLSVESINLAKQTYQDVSFSVGDMHNLNFLDNEFDFVYSSLAIHYSAQPNKVYEEIFRVLKSDGQLLFSTSHPIRWSSEAKEVDGISMRLTGYSENKSTPLVWGKYLSFSEREHRFPGGEVLKFFVGPPSLHFKLLKNSGFLVENFIESKVIEECKEVDQYYFERYSEIPQFMAFLVRKP